MSYINVEPYRGTTLKQDFKINRNRLYLKAIRPLLYFQNDPAGTFSFRVKDGTDLMANHEFTMADIKAGAGFNDGEHHYGFFDMPMNIVLTHDRLYTMELDAVGYTFGASHIGWIKEFENLTNSFDDDTIWTFHQNPFGYQLWGY